MYAHRLIRHGYKRIRKLVAYGMISLMVFGGQALAACACDDSNNLGAAKHVCCPLGKTHVCCTSHGRSVSPKSTVACKHGIVGHHCTQSITFITTSPALVPVKVDNSTSIFELSTFDRPPFSAVISAGRVVPPHSVAPPGNLVITLQRLII
jgi:hypothetical protein